jgi:pilus assembly protein FimV
MVAKRSSRALALLLALPSAAFALGLGDIHLLSPLNAPLSAEIEVTDIAPDEVNTLQASLAPRDTFAAQGLDYPTYLTSVQLKTVRTPDGRELIRIKSSDPISDPFVTLLIQVTWSHGQLVREYTVLLDPPVYAPGQSAAASAEVATPSTGAGTRAGEIARSSETPAPAAPAPAAAAPAPAESASAAAPSPAPASAAPAAEASGGGTHVVQRGETLSGIASTISDQKASAARTEEWMLAIYQANPRAFDQNMNVMRAGAVLRIPEAQQAAEISPSVAGSEIHRQYVAWRGAAGTAAAAAAPGAAAAAPAPAPAPEQPGRLRLVTPAQSASAGSATGASGAEVAQLQGRVHDLEGQLAESKRLLDLKNADLARLQAELAQKQAGQAAAAPPAPAQPAPEQPAAPQPAPAPAPTAQAPAPPSVAVAPAPAPAAAAPPPTSQPPPVTKPLAHRKPAPPAPAASGGSILDTLMSFWWLLVLAALVLIAVVILRFLRSRRASEFDGSLGRLAAAGAAAAESGRGLAAPVEHFDSGEVQELPPMRAAPPDPEPEVTIEETGSHERPRFAPAPAAAPAAPKHVTADDTISSETAINLDQGDPLAEADFHMAYGLYDQAADLIRIAIGREPTRRDLKLKLLEVFFVWGNKEQFLQTAHELAATRAEAAPGEWEKILIMGKQLAPEDELFSGGAAVTGAAAGGVDLNLEGGQSRVDFDLLGEPTPGDGSQSVDLDIGAAVGEHAGGATESTTNVTDRNLALESSAIRTGSTRQMTANLRQPAAEAEGPTVEQPALARSDNPTVRKKVETALRQGGGDQTQELALDDLGLDLGNADTVDQPALAPAPEGPTLVANLDDQARRGLEDAHTGAHAKTATTGQWSFDPEELESAVTQAGPIGGDASQTSRLSALREGQVDVDLSSEATGTHAMNGGDLDVDLSSATGTHAAANGGGLDLDVGTATVPDTAFAATQRLSSEELALPDLEPVTMSEVGTKLDLARAYMDMGDPEGARNILEEVLSEGSAAQKQEAQRLMESLPG